MQQKVLFYNGNCYELNKLTSISKKGGALTPPFPLFDMRRAFPREKLARILESKYHGLACFNQLEKSLSIVHKATNNR